jgi:broad specificity phosphatase PhoE
MKHLYFCRHGETEANANGVITGSLETPLTEKGRQQAKEAGLSAKSHGIDHIICSPLGRTHETALIIADAIGFPAEKIELNSLFVERHFGEMEGQPYDIDADIDGFVDVETTDTFLARARLALEHLNTLEAETILIVSHGKFGRALRTVIYPHIPLQDGDVKTRFPNGELVKLI